VGRLPGREEWKLELLASRLPAAPVTPALLADGRITVDQALSILSGTKRLSSLATARAWLAGAGQNPTFSRTHPGAARAGRVGRQGWGSTGARQVRCRRRSAPR
jgi:hypothetical protein